MQLDDMTWRPGVRFAVWWGFAASACGIALSMFDGFAYMRAFSFFVAFVSALIAANEWRRVASEIAEMLYKVMHTPGPVCKRCTSRRGRVIMTAGEHIPAGSVVSVGDDGLARRARGEDG